MTIASFAAVVFAALVRVFGPGLMPLHVLPVFLASGTAFAVGYLLFAIEFTPLLWRARID
ncbi:MAG: NnrS family protein [Myxococcales bacterium]|nr:NnrS family protein [Myxococcales bacterium]